MEISQDNFQIEHKNESINVRRHSVGKDVIFRVTFTNNKQPLVITRAARNSAGRFWTSIPEGRQREAEEIGALISEYFNSFT